MKPREYNIKAHSILRFLLVLIGIFLTSITLILDNMPWSDIKILSFLLITIIIVISVYLAHLASMGKVKILLNEEGIIHIWERRFFLSWEKNFKIPWNLVDNYVFEEDRTFDRFMINLTNQTRYKINRLNVIPIKDDFYRFVKEFPKQSNNYKNGILSEVEANYIEEGKSLYESKSFRYVFYFLSTGVIILLINKIFDSKSETSWGVLGVLVSGMLFYGLMIKNRTKKNNS
ncbi:MAG: hypothetical protein AB7O47_08140 [Flavobacteriales bacterium]